MNDIRKNKLTNYLYPTKDIQEFMLYDLYVELISLLTKKVCFSVDNMKEEARKTNLNKAKLIISSFLDNNLNYKKRLIELNLKIEDNLIEEILWGYILFITTNINNGTGADVFWDKRSVCYSKSSIIDLL